MKTHNNRIIGHKKLPCAPLFVSDYARPYVQEAGIWWCREMNLIKYYLFSLFCFWSVAAIPMELEQSHGQWQSGMLVRDDGSPTFRAFSSVERKSVLTVFFALDIYPDCKSVNPNLLVVIPEGVDNSGYLNLGSFQARVDIRKVINGVWTSSVNEMGDTVVFMSLITDDEATLISDMKLGNTLRIKIGFLEKDKEDLYFNFSLNGSSAAINRAFALCQARRNSERKYFDQKSPITPKPSKSDSEYFL